MSSVLLGGGDGLSYLFSFVTFPHSFVLVLSFFLPFFFFLFPSHLPSLVPFFYPISNRIVIVIHKMLMTGAMVVIAPGTSAQPLVATLFQLFFLLLVLKLAPYDGDADDYSSFIASLTLALTMLCGFAIMAQEGKESDFGDANFIGYLLVTISITCMVLNTGIMMWDMDWSHYKRLPCAKWAMAKKEAAAKKKAKLSSVKVAPEPKSQDNLKDRAQAAWGKN